MQTEDSAMTRSLLDRDASVLLMIDMQTRLTAAMKTEAWNDTRATAIMLARAAEELAIPTLVTRQYPRGLGDTDPDLAAALPAHAQTVDKMSFSACSEEHFAETLRATGRGQVVICGMEAHVCVLQTAMELLAAGYRPFMVADGVCSRDAGHRDNALERLRAAGTIVTNRESVIFEWLRDANDARFRTVTALLK